jgi:hypothetical protein
MADYYWAAPADVRRDVREDEWISADGGRLRIADMTDSHLFFALAKGYRGEYGAGGFAARQMPKLEAEAARRLAEKTRPVRVEGFR